MLDAEAYAQTVSAASIPCVVYAAKSTEDKHGSIPGQLADCRAAIDAAQGRAIVAEYRDDAVSAYTGNRGNARRHLCRWLPGIP